METISLEDKKKIVARNFFTENRDQYENYEESLADMENVSNEFIDFAVQPFIIREHDRYLMMNDQGILLSVKNEDGHVRPITLMSDEEGESLEESFTEESEKNPEINSAVRLLQNIGWRII